MDRHPAGLGELDGIPDQIQEDLPHAMGIAEDRRGEIAGNAGRQGEAARLCAGRTRLGDVTNGLADVVRDVFEREATGLDLREI